jgi:hypothetical protein
VGRSEGVQSGGYSLLLRVCTICWCLSARRQDVTTYRTALLTFCIGGRVAAHATVTALWATPCRWGLPECHGGATSRAVCKTVGGAHLEDSAGKLQGSLYRINGLISFVRGFLLTPRVLGALWSEMEGYVLSPLDVLSGSLWCAEENHYDPQTRLVVFGARFSPRSPGA